MDNLAELIERHWIVRILDSLAKLGIVVALLSWGFEFSERKQQRDIAKRSAVYQAHEVLALSHFRSSTAAGLALEDLIKAKQDFFGMDLTSLTISNVNLSNADFSKTDFGESKFKNVRLINTNFSDAELANTSYEDVNMSGANLQGVYFEGADLRGVNNLTSAQLSAAILCKNTKHPISLTGLELGLTKEQEMKMREEYDDNDYIKASIEACGFQ